MKLEFCKRSLKKRHGVRELNKGCQKRLHLGFRHGGVGNDEIQDVTAGGSVMMEITVA